MKKIIFITLILATSVYAKDSISIGTFADGTEFMAEKHFYGKHIDGFTPVQGKPQLCMRIGEKNSSVQQELGLYDISEHRMKWTIDVDYSKDYYIATKLGVLLFSDKKTYFLNEEGDICWEKKNYRPFYADVRDSVVVGYTSTKSKLLNGISMKQGEDLWDVEVSQKGGWREMRTFEDGSMLISSDKIFKLNAHTGDMCSFDVDNIHQNNKGAWLAALGSAIGFGVGMAFGGPIICSIPSNEDSNFYQLNSNFCIDDNNHIYYADRCRLYCLDNNLHIIWEQELPKRSSFSYLDIQDDTLFFENTGYGKNLNGYYYCDTKPYEMRYDRKNGTELSERKSLKDKDYYVNCFMKEPDKPCFTTRRLTYKEMDKLKKKRVDVYQTYRKLSQTHSLIFCDKDFYIIDLDGNVLLHFSEPIIQAELVDNVLVGLTDLDVIFQFDLSSLKI